MKKILLVVVLSVFGIGCMSGGEVPEDLLENYPAANKQVCLNSIEAAKVVGADLTAENCGVVYEGVVTSPEDADCEIEGKTYIAFSFQGRELVAVMYVDGKMCGFEASTNAGGGSIFDWLCVQSDGFVGGVIEKSTGDLGFVGWIKNKDIEGEFLGVEVGSDPNSPFSGYVTNSYFGKYGGQQREDMWVKSPQCSQ